MTGIALTGVFLAGALLIEARVALRPADEAAEKGPAAQEPADAGGGGFSPERQGTRTDSLDLPPAVPGPGERDEQPADPDSLYEMGGIQVRLHRDEEAVVTFARLAAEHPGHELADEALWQAAKAAERGGDYTRARDLFGQLVDEHPRSPMRDQANWSAAFMLYCAGRYREALYMFQRVGVDASEPHLVDQSFFWAGKSARRLGLEQEAEVLFQAAADHFPRSYYSARAVSMGYRGSKGRRPRNHAAPDDVGHTWEHVRTAAGEAGLDPYLVLAVIRQESRFEERAESHAGALGVMQIMPRTGRSLASKAGMGDFEKGLLADPEVSIRMGSRYLGEQMRSFASGRTREVGFELGLAAYNAGPSAARQWVRHLPLDDADTFVERIPYKETRIYVKKVLKNYTVYKTAVSSA